MNDVDWFLKMQLTNMSDKEGVSLYVSNGGSLIILFGMMEDT